MLDYFLTGRSILPVLISEVRLDRTQVNNMVLSPSLGDGGRQGSHFVSGGGQKVAVVSRHTRACPLVPPTMSSRRWWRRRRRQRRRRQQRRRDGFSPLRFVLPKRQGERRCTPLPWPTFSSSIPLRDELPTLCPRFPHLGEPDHLPFCTRRTLWPSSPRRNAPPPPFLPLTGHCRHDHYRLLLWLSSTSNGDDPTHPTVARYYHSVLLAIYRPLSTTLPPNGVYRCCLAAWLRSRSQRFP